MIKTNEEQKIGKIIYELNKEAKMVRDRELESYGSEDFEILREKKMEIYRKKDAILDLFTPVYIHRQTRDKEFLLKEPTGEFRTVVIPIRSYSLVYKIGTFTFHKPFARDEYLKYDRNLISVNEQDILKEYNLEIIDYI